MKQNKKIKCIYCNKPIHIGKLGGVSKSGWFCNDTFCLMKLAKEVKSE